MNDTGVDNNQFIYSIALLSVVICVIAWSLLGQWGGSPVGIEMSDIAERILKGYGFSSPYLPPENLPTTVSPPLYVWLIVPIYKILGINTITARVFLQCLNLVFQCVTLVVLYRLCEKLFSPLCAKVFAIIFIVHPSLIFLALSVWENSLTMMLLAATLSILVFRFKKFGIAGWLFFGVLLGLISLSNPVWTIGYPFFCIGAFYFNENFSLRRFALGTALIFAGFSIVTGPWIYRDYQVTHKLMFVRGMAGPEWFKGNNAESFGGHGEGFIKYFLYVSAEEREKLKNLGEVAYDEMMMSAAKTEIKAHPGRYVLITAARIAQWWSGDIDLTVWHLHQGHKTQFASGVLLTLAGLITSIFSLLGIIKLRAQFKTLWPLWVYLFILPIPYYLVVIGFRYQATLTPFLLIPAAYFIAEKWGASITGVFAKK